MVYITIFAISVGLAMDAFSVSIASGAVYKKMNIGHTFRLAFFFGFFQMFMPLLGWLCGSFVREYIQPFGNIAAFIILTAVGIKMIYEAFSLEHSDKKNLEMTILILIMLSVATSLDALAVGLTLSLIDMQIVEAVVIIGVVTFVLSLIGVYIGKRFGHFFEKKIEVAGGIILIFMGLKLLWQGLM